MTNHEISKNQLENTVDTSTTGNGSYHERLREQRDELVAQNPNNAWMINLAYDITINPSHGRRRR